MKGRIASTLAGKVTNKVVWQFLNRNPPPVSAKTKRAVAASAFDRYRDTSVTLSTPPWKDET